MPSVEDDPCCNGTARMHCRGTFCRGGDCCGIPDSPGTDCKCECPDCMWQKGFTAGYRQCRADNEADALEDG